MFQSSLRSVNCGKRTRSILGSTRRRKALTATVPALLQTNRSPPSQPRPCPVPYDHPRPKIPIHSAKLVLATPFLRPNHASTTRLTATAHSKRIAPSCQTGKASFNAPYRKHRGPTTAAHSRSSHLPRCFRYGPRRSGKVGFSIAVAVHLLPLIG
jgi:hypothetical protein